jgi:predicted negative regulator of RcsB-dependent stress response
VDEFQSEKEQWEDVKRWVRENGPFIAAGVLMGAGILFGWRWWQERGERLDLQASAKYMQVLEAYGRGDGTRATTLVADLERDSPHSPYLDQARLVAARAAVETAQFDTAAQQLTRVMNESRDPQLQKVARLRLARVQIAASKPDAALATLAAVDAGAFAPLYTEVRGDALLAKGDRAGALKEYRAALAARPAGADTGASLIELKIKDLSAS